jgi:tripartite-type tricarboxylate transporter receptor subunit TctC
MRGDITKRDMLKSLGACLALLVAGQLSAHSADLPAKTIRIILGQPVGGGPDIIVRMLALRMGADLDRTFIVDNKPGAGGSIAMGAARQGATDGSDLVLVDPGILNINPFVFKKLPYDAAKDFESVGMIFSAPFFLAVPANSTFQSVRDLVTFAKANPGKINYGTFGVAHTSHLLMERFMLATGITMQHIPFKDPAQLVSAAVNGDIGVLLNGVASIRSGVDTGKLRLLAVATERRQASFPSVPTISESAGIEVDPLGAWVGFMVPKGVPREVIGRLNVSLQRALADPAIQARMAAFAMSPDPGPPEHFAAHIAAEHERYRAVFKTLKIQMD